MKATAHLTTMESGTQENMIKWHPGDGKGEGEDLSLDLQGFASYTGVTFAFGMSFSYLHEFFWDLIEV